MKRGRYERMKDKLSLTHGMDGDMLGGEGKGDQERLYLRGARLG